MFQTVFFFSFYFSKDLQLLLIFSCKMSIILQIDHVQKLHNSLRELHILFLSGWSLFKCWSIDTTVVLLGLFSPLLAKLLVMFTFHLSSISLSKSPIYVSISLFSNLIALKLEMHSYSELIHLSFSILPQVDLKLLQSNDLIYN